MNTPSRSSFFNQAQNSSAQPGNDGGEAAASADANVSWQLKADLEALREREANLREYENWLRAWQTQLDADGSRGPRTSGPTPRNSTAPANPRASSETPHYTDSSLEAAWEKFHRARALMEAEQNQIRDDRVMLREGETSLKRREAEIVQRELQVAEREMRLAEREQQVAGQPPVTAVPDANKPRTSTVRRFAHAPFLVARSVFGPTN